jgi:uncharacterized protein
MTPLQMALLGGASLIAGAINSIAGGGTVVSFPAAIAAGLSPVMANATNAVALTPASLASAWAYRSEVVAEKKRVRLFFVPALVGGLAGSALLLATPQKVFDAVVPLLLLSATVLLFVQNLRKPATSTKIEVEPESRARTIGAMLLQLLVAVYGGYFGAGMGIMMLAIYGMLGIADIHRMNAVKALMAGLINGVAAAYFLARGAIDLRAAILMAVAASVGGWVGAALARRVDPRTVRWAVAAIGVLLTVVYAVRQYKA